MRNLILPLVAVVSLASHALGTAIGPNNIVNLLATPPFDPNDIPKSCAGRCSDIASTFNTCANSTSASCGCSTKDEQSFVDCLNCLTHNGGGNPSASQMQSIQSYVDDYVTTCNSLGVSLPATTLSGASPVTFTRGNPASATSGTAAATSSVSDDDEVTTSASNQPTVTSPATPSNTPTGLSGQNSATSIRGRKLAAVVAAFAVVCGVFF